MFGMGKKKQPSSIEETVPPFEIGKNGTVADFYAAHKRYAEKRDSYGAYSGGNDQRELHKGAIAGFLDGDIDNLQALLADTAAFAIVSPYLGPSSLESESILLRLTQGRDQPAVLIRLAIDKVAEDEKQSFLDHVLLAAMQKCGGEKDFIAALLDAGAQANCTDRKGFRGEALVRAVCYERPLPVVQLLYDHGADFGDALFLMHAQDYGQEKIQRLKFYREQITGLPATIEVTPDTMQQLLEQVRELTEKVNALQSEALRNKTSRNTRGTPRPKP